MRKMWTLLEVVPDGQSFNSAVPAPPDVLGSVGFVSASHCPREGCQDVAGRLRKRRRRSTSESPPEDTLPSSQTNCSSWGLQNPLEEFRKYRWIFLGFLNEKKCEEDWSVSTSTRDPSRVLREPGWLVIHLKLCRGCFGNVYVDDGGVRCGVFAFQERKVGQTSTKLRVMDILKNRGESASPFKACDMSVGSEKHGVVFMITKAGVLFMFDIGTGTMLVRSRVSQETVLITVGSALTGGIVSSIREGRSECQGQ
eukprot:s3101_g10.t2